MLTARGALSTDPWCVLLRCALSRNQHTHITSSPPPLAGLRSADSAIGAGVGNDFVLARVSVAAHTEISTFKGAAPLLKGFGSFVSGAFLFKDGREAAEAFSACREGSE